MTPLYLEGRKGVSVSLDAPALSVEQLNKTRQLFPLSRISRVVVSGKVDWSQAALMACADAGISVVFLTRQGQVRCCLIGRPKCRQAVVQQFLPLFERADALLHYQNWQLGMERMAVRSAARRLGFADWQVAEPMFLKCWLTDNISAEWVALQALLRGFLFSSCLGYLQEMGLDAECETLLTEPFNLVDDLAELLLWDFYAVLVGWYKRSCRLPERCQLLSFYQKRSQRVEHLIRGLLSRLHQCLLEGR